MNRQLSACLVSILAITVPRWCWASDSAIATAARLALPDACANISTSTSAETKPAKENEVNRSTSQSAAMPVLTTTVKVAAQALARETTEGFEKTVSEKEIEAAAGAFGDPSRFMQLLPGVVSDNDQYNDFIVRGGVPSEDLFIVDNIEVPSINHLALADTTGGFVSMIDGEAVQKMTLHNDAYDSKYDQRLSSIVEISTRPEQGVHSRSESEIGIAGVGGSMTRGWGTGGSLFVSGRRSILNLLTNDIGMNGVPVYTNSLARADDRAGERDSWWGLSLTGVDSIAIRPSATDTWETDPYDIDYMGWRNTTGINWQHISSANSFGVLSLSNSEQSQSVSDRAQLQNNESVYLERTKDGTSTVKYDETVQPARGITVFAGARESIDRLDYRVNQPVGLQNPYSEDSAPLDAMHLNRKFGAMSSAGYGQAAVALPRGAKLVIGERFSQWTILVSKVLTPKALVMVPIWGRTIHAGYAEYAQLPPTLYVLAFQNRKTLTPIHSRQITAGIDLLQTRALRMSVEGYQKHYEDYPVAQSYPQLSLGNVADTFGQAFLMFPMINRGRGRAEGAELSFGYRSQFGLELTSAITYSRSWYSGLDGDLRRGAFDLPFVANIAGTQHLKKHFSLNFRYSDAAGRPYTPDNLTLSQSQNRDVYDLTKVNAARGPAYHRLDLRVEQEHSAGKGVVSWHVGLENALGTNNFYSYAWRPRGGNAGVLAQEQMPRFPDGGIKYSF